MSKKDKKETTPDKEHRQERELSRRELLKKGFSAAVAGLLFGGTYTTLATGCQYDDSGYSDGYSDSYSDYYSDYYSDSYSDYYSEYYYNYSDTYYEYYDNYYNYTA